MLIVLPVAVLAAVGLFSLRQDKVLAEQEAREQAQGIAWPLAHECAARLRTEIDQFAEVSSRQQDLIALTAGILQRGPGDKALTKLLVDKGADMNVKSKDGYTGRLQALSGEPQRDLIELFLTNKADPNLKGRAGYTGLHSAAARGDIEMAKLLLAKGAEVNVRDDAGNTPLHYAALNGMKAMVEFLLNSKADASITNEPGFTALRLVSDPQILTQYGQNEWGIPSPVGGGIVPPRRITSQQLAVADLLRRYGAKQ